MRSKLVLRTYLLEKESEHIVTDAMAARWPGHQLYRRLSARTAYARVSRHPCTPSHDDYRVDAKKALGNLTEIITYPRR
jgi:hypothetical protein